MSWIWSAGVRVGPCTLFATLPHSAAREWLCSMFIIYSSGDNNTLGVSSTYLVITTPLVCYLHMYKIKVFPWQIPMLGHEL